MGLLCGCFNLLQTVLKTGFQVIITEHADIQKDWYQEMVNQKWWDGKNKLVPLEWIRRLLKQQILHPTGYVSPATKPSPIPKTTPNQKSTIPLILKVPDLSRKDAKQTAWGLFEGRAASEP